MTREEPCEKCRTVSQRQFVPRRIHFNKAKVTHAEFNPGLGCVVKNDRHKADLLKQRGLVEIGNDFKSPDAIQQKFDTERTEKFEARYEQALSTATEGI